MDYNRARDRKDVQTLLNAYAATRWAMSRCRPTARQLAQCSDCCPWHSQCAYDAVSNEALGLCNCFEGFSTFKCKR